MNIKKWSFWTCCTIAVLCLVTMILHFCGVNAKIVNIVQSIAFAIALILVSISAWGYVAKKQVVWKVLYFFILAILLVCIILPLVM